MAKKLEPDKGVKFKSENDFESWLSKNHAKSKGIWVRMYKKSAAVQSISTAALIDVLLCYGWITGPARKGNDLYNLWWVCPRKENSSWSKLNMAHAKRLIEEHKMKPSGMLEIDKAKASGQWAKY